MLGCPTNIVERNALLDPTPTVFSDRFFQPICLIQQFVKFRTPFVFEWSLNSCHLLSSFVFTNFGFVMILDNSAINLVYYLVNILPRRQIDMMSTKMFVFE